MTTVNNRVHAALKNATVPVNGTRKYTNEDSLRVGDLARTLGRMGGTSDSTLDSINTESFRREAAMRAMAALIASTPPEDPATGYTSLEISGISGEAVAFANSLIANTSNP